MNLGSVHDHDIDAFGDAYEYLMTMYASNAGKSGGGFFTPADVSELLTRLGTVGKTEVNKVYDPACGSGSLLLKALKILGKDAVRNGFYGQEMTNNNKLTSENVDKIVDVFTRREEVKHFTHLAGYEEVAENDYNLSVSTYVEAKDTREKIDIKKLNAEIEQIVAREQVLRDEIAKIIAEIEV